MEAKTKGNLKKTGGIILNVILWIFVIFCVLVTVVAFSANGNAKGVPTVGGKCFLNVQTGSMDASLPEWVPDGKPAGFSAGSMIVGEYIADSAEKIDALEVGDVIAFEWDITGDGRIQPGESNTHRIVSIERNASGTVISVKTQGDNTEYSMGQTETVSRSAIIARYTGTKIVGLGAVMTFLSSRLGFGLCILLPLLLFFVYEIIVFVRAVMKVRGEDKKLISAEDEEMIRRAAVEEYIRRQAESAEKPADKKDDAGDAEEKSDEENKN